MHAEPTTFRDTPCLRLHAGGASALLALHGGQVLSWRPADGRERLFLGQRAVFDGHAAIRGGIPVIFPQFAERGPLPKHGFARTRTWSFAGTEGDRAIVELTGDGGDPAWPHPFRARLSIALGPATLAVALEIANTGATPFAFTAALHTYLRVADIASATLQGLHGCDYEDSANGGTLHRADDDLLSFDGEVDRIYGDVVAPLRLDDGDHPLAIEPHGFPDAVVWNPGEHVAARIGDLAPGEYRHFVCVEAAQVLQPAVLAPGDRWRGSQVLG